MTIAQNIVNVYSFSSKDRAFILKAINETVGNNKVSETMSSLVFNWYAMMYSTLRKIERSLNYTLSSRTDWEEVEWLKRLLMDYSKKASNDDDKQMALDLLLAIKDEMEVI